jgi:hypothetical protein
MTSRLTSGLAIAVVAAALFAGTAAAQTTDIASGGNGGVSNANSNGGSVSVGTTRSGGSTGSSVQAAINDALVDGDDIAQHVIEAILGG